MTQLHRLRLSKVRGAGRDQRPRCPEFPLVQWQNWANIVAVTRKNGYLCSDSTCKSRFDTHAAGIGLLLTLACNHAPNDAVKRPPVSSAVYGASREYPPQQRTSEGIDAGTHAGASSGGSRLPEAPRDAAPQLGESSATAPTPPAVVFHGEAKSASEFELEAKGFPAVSSDRKLVAVAFHELNTTGPPALELGVQLRSVGTGHVVYAAKFREPYRGERGEAYLNELRHRVFVWVDGVTQRLAKARLVSIGLIVRDDAAVCNDEASPLYVPTPPIEVRYGFGRLVVRDGAAREVFERAYPEWTRTNGNFHSSCVYKPYVAEVAFDSQSKVLVVKAEHCSPSDNCLEGIAPDFAIVALAL